VGNLREQSQNKLNQLKKQLSFVHVLKNSAQQAQADKEKSISVANLKSCGCFER